MIKYTLTVGLYKEKEVRYIPMYVKTEEAQKVNSP